jgi:hypothetical protein
MNGSTNSLTLFFATLLLFLAPAKPADAQRPISPAAPLIIQNQTRLRNENAQLKKDIKDIKEAMGIEEPEQTYYAPPLAEDPVFGPIIRGIFFLVAFALPAFLFGLSLLLGFANHPIRLTKFFVAVLGILVASWLTSPLTAAVLRYALDCSDGVGLRPLTEYYLHPEQTNPKTATDVFLFRDSTEILTLIATAAPLVIWYTFYDEAVYKKGRPGIGLQLGNKLSAWRTNTPAQPHHQQEVKSRSLWLKATTGKIKGPFTELQVLKALKAGKLSKDVKVSESQNGPWKTVVVR